MVSFWKIAGDAGIVRGVSRKSRRVWRGSNSEQITGIKLTLPALAVRWITVKPRPQNTDTIPPRTRGEFLSQFGQGMLAATVGYEVATGLGLSPARAEEAAGALDFGPIEPLVRLMQDTAADKLLPVLAEGISPADIGEAITLAANQLVLRDRGRTRDMEVPGKPHGSVHGDSIGVHASDSANTWRNMARAGNARNCCAILILGAYQVARDRVERGGDFLNWKPLPVEGHAKGIKTTDAEGLLREADGAIRGNLQAHAAAIIHRYGELGHDPKGAFDLLRRYATTEDGALHAEKYFRTCTEEFAATRPVYRWRHVVSLARVTASEYGRPAAGIAQARKLLKV